MEKSYQKYFVSFQVWFTYINRGINLRIPMHLMAITESKDEGKYLVMLARLQQCMTMCQVLNPTFINLGNRKQKNTDMPACLFFYATEQIKGAFTWNGLYLQYIKFPDV